MGAASKTKISVKSINWKPTEVGGLTIANAGQDYTGIPTLTFAEPDQTPGERAEARAVITGGKISSVILTNPGSGYKAGAPAITIAGGGGTGGDVTAELAHLGAYYKLTGRSFIRELKCGPFKLNDEWDDRTGLEDAVAQMRANEFRAYENVTLSYVAKSSVRGPQDFFDVVREDMTVPFWIRWEYADGSIDEATFGVGSVSNPTDPKKVTMGEVECIAYGSYVKTARAA